MKSRKHFYILHFIIFFSNIFFSNPNPQTTLQSPYYSILDFPNPQKKNNSISFSIWTNEFLFLNVSNSFPYFSYFITTSKTGIISIITKNETLFSIDLKKKMYKTIFNQENIMKGENVILPMEGKLFRVKTNIEKETFEEFTTPINELVDMTPFSIWFSEDYYFKAVDIGEDGNIFSY